MIVLDGSHDLWNLDRDTSVTIGVLDGVHLGHRSLLAHLDPALARTVLTFDPHPVEVLRPGSPPRLLTLIDERIHLLESAGVSVAGVLDLAEIKDLSPEDFVGEILVPRLRMRHLVVGEDFRFGRDRSGDIRTLRRLAGEHDFAVETIDIVEDGSGEAVSSSRIRVLVETGDVSTAAELLGSRYRITNTVVHGDKRGRDIGFPTANLRPPERKLIPARGVYACFAHVSDTAHQAAVNVGIRPTFGGEDLLIEAYLLDFEADLYGEEMTVEFVDYLRPELDFDTVEALVEQMRHDVARSRSILQTAPVGI